MAPHASIDTISSSCLLIFCRLLRPCSGWIYNNGVNQMNRSTQAFQQGPTTRHNALSSEYLENDLVAIQIPPNADGGDNDIADRSPRLCVVRPDGGVYPLCFHEDDVETDLFVDPRVSSQAWTEDVADDDVTRTYGEGWYGQRPVPSLGGGPGYGAEADSVWSVDEDVLERLQEDGVDLPVLDVGIAHGEKARGGAF